MADFETTLLAGFAQLLADAGIGQWSNDPAVAYVTSGPLGIYLDELPSNNEDGIAVTSYPVSDAGTLGDSVVGVQFITRRSGHNGDATRETDGAIFAALHGRVDIDMAGGIHVVQVLRRSTANLGQDGGERWARSTNYYVDVNWPSANRL